MQIKVEKLSTEELAKRGIMKCPVWEKEVSRFDWEYDSVEECFILDGKVSVSSPSGETVSFGKGDFVTFPKGLACTWNVIEPVRKHYRFK